MIVSVDDIFSKKFIERNGNYDADDVDSFLNDIMDTMDTMQREYDRLKNELKQAQSGASDYAGEEVEKLNQQVSVLQNQLRQAQASSAEADQLRTMVSQLRSQLDQAQRELSEAKASSKSSVAQTSQTLEGILERAQQFADEAVAKAKVRADGIVNEAKVKADKIVGDAQGEKDILSSELTALKKTVGDYRKGFEELLQKYSALLKDDEFFH